MGARGRVLQSAIRAVHDAPEISLRTLKGPSLFSTEHEGEGLFLVPVNKFLDHSSE